MIMNKARKEFTSGLHDKHYYPSLEDLKPKVWYEITISPQEQFRDSPFRLRDVYQDCVKNLFGMFSSELNLHTEISTKSQNIHYHGKLRFHKQAEITKFYLNINKIKDKCSFALNECRPLDSPLGNWELYCRKQQTHIRSLLHSSLIYKDIHQHFIIKYN